MQPAALVFDGADEHDLLSWQPPCVEREVLDLGSTWVHGYTGIDVGRWRRLAANLATEVREAKGPDGQPTSEALAFAQAVVVCRQGPGSELPTFRVDFAGAAQAWGAFQRLPGTWVESVCRESDALTLSGYRRPARTGESGQALVRLGERLGDEEFWRALDLLSAKLFGVGIAENGRPLAGVLSLLESDVEARAMLVAALAPLAALVG